MIESMFNVSSIESFEENLIGKKMEQEEHGSLFETYATAIDRKSIDFHAIASSLLTLKWGCRRIRGKLSLLSASFPFCGVQVCGRFVCLFSRLISVEG
jgi:hypothetical protein